MDSHQGCNPIRHSKIELFGKRNQKFYYFEYVQDLYFHSYSLTWSGLWLIVSTFPGTLDFFFFLASMSFHTVSDGAQGALRTNMSYLHEVWLSYCKQQISLGALKTSSHLRGMFQWPLSQGYGVHTLALSGKTGGGQSTFSEMVQNRQSGFMSAVQSDIQYIRVEYRCRIGRFRRLVLVLRCYFGDSVYVL